MKKRLLIVLLAGLLICFFACSKAGKDTGSKVNKADTSGMDFDFSDEEKPNTPGGGETVTAGMTITKEGTYKITGDFTGPVVIDAGKDDVQLILENASITATNGPAIFVKEADKVYITLLGTNTVKDGASYATAYTADNVDGAIFSRGDLAIGGDGSLTVEAVYKHGIVSKDDLSITGGSITVNAPNVALNGKDCVKITACQLNLTAGTDGIRSDNEEDADRGYVYIKDGTIRITSGSDAIQAVTVIKCEEPVITIKTTAGKGLKAKSDILISGGSYTIDSKDDCIHSNHTISYTGGTARLTSGDDGVHADTDLEVTGGEIIVTKSYEGMEASKVLISGGKMNLTATDDGIAAGGNDGSSIGGRPGQGGFSSSTGEISISGGYILINAAGDGVDSNGPITLSGGVVLVSGPTSGMNGAFDCDGTATVTGGFLLALGSNSMAQGFSTAQNQGAALRTFSSQQGGKNFAVCDANGNVVISFTPSKTYASATITAPGIQLNGTYTIVVGGTLSAADENGFASSGTVTGGTTVGTFTMTSLVLGGSSGPGGGPGGRPPRP